MVTCSFNLDAQNGPPPQHRISRRISWQNAPQSTVEAYLWQIKPDRRM